MDTTRFSLLFSTMLLMFGSMTLAAQPRIAYIMPDIGAENMNTAVEIIAEHDATSTFGTDGIYANNPGDPVRVEPTGPRAADLVVGPLVVSWNGRLISTQVFVRPNAPNGTIQLRVTSPAGQATVPFEIVTPISSVNNPGAGALGSGGGYGSRSKRGAMIVERLILTDGATSSVSTTDPDGSTPGNQGYLPMIIIARELVSIRLNQIDVSGNGKHAGPGGGGGGGQNCDSRPIGGGGREGAAGGDGYTGGGGGGRNGAGSSAGSGDNRSKPAGAGSGSGGGGLSGVAAAFGSADCTNPEGAGGGTGHPFGRGGQNGCVGYLGYYGGGGDPQRRIQ